MFTNTSEFRLHCYGSKPGIFVFIAFTVTDIFTLPLHTFILYIGYQRWTQQRSTSTNHTDIFTYYMVALEFFAVFGCSLYSCGALAENESLIFLGLDFLSTTSSAQVMFNLLTCAERYLAVIHPVTYRKLKQRGGVRVRNVCICCVFLLCSGFLVTTILKIKPVSSVSTSCFLVLALIMASFCSLSVLRVLIRPGPGEVGGDRAQVDQTKKKAFQTITVILGTLLLRFVSTLISALIFSSEATDTKCVVGSSIIWFTLPSSLVLPLLFVHRAGKLWGCKHNSESG